MRIKHIERVYGGNHSANSNGYKFCLGGTIKRQSWEDTDILKEGV